MSRNQKYSKVGPYILMETLGSGSFGKVKLAVHEKTYERFACKILDKSLVRQRVLNKQVRKEIAIMQTLNHRNTVSIVSVLSTHSKVFLVMELVNGGELFDEIRRHRRLSEPYARFYFRQLISGLQHCHDHGVYHRDLKPENLLLDENKTLKITDFGLSTLISESVTGSLLLHTVCGTPNYVAPEMITDDPVGYSGAKVDAWSCGIILFVLCTGTLPFDGEDTESLFAQILRRDIKYPPWFSSSLKDLIGNILAEAEKRYSLADIRRHPWFNGRIETSMDGERIEPTLALSDYPTPIPSQRANVVAHHLPDMAHGHFGDHVQTPSATQPGQPSLLSQYVHMPASNQGQSAISGMNRRIDSLDFGIRAESIDGTFGDANETVRGNPFGSRMLPAAISENRLPGNPSEPVPARNEPPAPPDGIKNHIDRFRSRVFGPSTGSSVQSSDDDHESEFEDAQEVRVPPGFRGSRVLEVKGKASQLYANETRRRGHSWNQGTEQNHVAPNTMSEDKGAIIQIPSADPGMRRRVKRELWNHDADSWRDSEAFAEATWNHAIDSVRRPGQVSTYEHVSGYGSGEANAEADDVKRAQAGSGDIDGRHTEPADGETTVRNAELMDATFPTETTKIVRTVSHDGIPLSAKTRRRPRPGHNAVTRKIPPSQSVVPRAPGHPTAQRLLPENMTRDVTHGGSETKRILRRPSQQRLSRSESTRQDTVRFNDMGEEGLAEGRGFGSDRDWVETDLGKMLWCRMMKDYDMVPDADEYDMDSLALNELWTRGLQRESLGRPVSFAAQRFGSRRFTVTRSTQYLASQASRSEVERWASLSVDKGTENSQTKGLNGPKGANRVVFRDPSPSSAVASNASSPTSVREDGELSRAVSSPDISAGSMARRGLGRESSPMPTSAGTAGRVTFADSAHRSPVVSIKDKDYFIGHDSNCVAATGEYVIDRKEIISPTHDTRETEVVNVPAKLSSIPGQILRETVSSPLVSSPAKSRAVVARRALKQKLSRAAGTESSTEIGNDMTGLASRSNVDDLDVLSETKIRLGGNRDLLWDEADHTDDSDDEDEYESEGASGAIGAEPPPGMRRYDSKRMEMRRNSKLDRDKGIHSTGLGALTSSDASGNTDRQHTGSGQKSEAPLDRQVWDSSAMASSDFAATNFGIMRSGEKEESVSGEAPRMDRHTTEAVGNGGGEGDQVDEVVAAELTGVMPRSGSPPGHERAKKELGSVRSGREGSRSSGGRGRTRRGSGSISAGDVNVVSPFSMEIPGPRRRLVTSGTGSGVGSLLLRVGSARRFFEKQPPPMYGNKTTLFHSVLKPARCHSLIRELLTEYGCTILKPSPQRGRKRFTIKCEYKTDQVNVGATIRICGYDDVLSSVTFKKRASSDSEAFAAFYTDIQRMYRERAKGMGGSSSTAEKEGEDKGKEGSGDAGTGVGEGKKEGGHMA